MVFGKRSVFEKNRTIWSVNLGEFKQGDTVSYTVHAGINGQASKSTKTFYFTVTERDCVDKVLDVRNLGDRVELECTSQSGTFRPLIIISFSDDSHLRLQMDPLGKGPFSPGSIKYSMDESESDHILLSTNSIKVKISKNPYSMEVCKKDDLLAVREYDTKKGMNLKFLTDGSKIIKSIEHNLFSPVDESFHGFGMRYNALNQRGKNMDTYCVNWYLDQGDKTYIPIPFYFTNHGYGYYMNSTYYSQFRLATEDDDRCSISVNTGGEVNTVYDAYLFIDENNQEIMKQYTSVVGKPRLPPVWAFGPWISANEWNKQEEIEEQISQTIENNIGTSVIVIEAWSDEETFYIFNCSRRMIRLMLSKTGLY